MEQFDPYQEWLDIPREERPIDHYRLLGIGQFESRREVIERAADKRMAHVRKFQMGPRGRSTQNLLNELSTAKLCLLGTDSRERYDATLRMPASPAPQPAPTAPSPAAQLAAPPQPSSQTPVPPPIGTMDQPPVAADAEPPPPPGPAPPPGPSPPRRSPAGASLRKTASVAARRRRRASSAGCMLILGAIGLVIGGFAFLLVVSRPNPAGVTREQLATDDPPPVEVEEPSGPVVVMQEGNGSVNLSAAVAVLHGESLKLSNGIESTVIADWDSTDQWVQWQFRLVKPGVFQVDIHYTIDEDAAGGSFELLVDHRVVKVCSLRSPDAANAEVVDHYFVRIGRSGRHSLAVRPTRKPGKEFMRLFQVRLIPKQGGRAES